jgi:hypothetical protein
MREALIKTIEPYSGSSGNNVTYYESQVRELYGNNNAYQSPVYASNVQNSTTYYQRPEGGNTIQYTTKALRPGSSQ